VWRVAWLGESIAAEAGDGTDLIRQLRAAADVPARGGEQPVDFGADLGLRGGHAMSVVGRCLSVAWARVCGGCSRLQPIVQGLNEAARRARQIDSGEVALIPADEVTEEARALVQ